jgi:HAD superfamily hydrolase (TIGR01549 family)
MYLTNVAALSLDLDDTLWDFDAAVVRAEAALYQWLLQRSPATATTLSGPESLRQLRHNTAIARPDLSYDPARLRQESIREALRAVKCDPDLSDEGYDIFFAERQHVELFDDVRPALEWLSHRYPIAAITNGNSDLEAIGIRDFFSANLIATEFGIAKPDPRIFHAAANALGFAPTQILHIGDDLRLDFEGALSAGFQAAWLVRTKLAVCTNKPNELTGSRLILRNLLELCNLLGLKEH